MNPLLPSRSNPKPKETGPQDALRRREALMGFLFLSPWIVGFVLLKLVPILGALGFSFTNFHMTTPQATSFIGVANYLHFLTDLRAWSSLARSLGYFAITVPLELFLALGLAALFSSERLRGKGVLRTLFFMPSIIPAAAILSIVRGLLDPRSGWLTLLILAPLGLPPLGRGGGGLSFLSIMLSMWSIGPGFLIMYAAMQNVPSEIIESARVDGAGPLNRFVNITLPIISPAVFFSLVINLTSAFGGSVLLDRGYLYSQSLSPMEGYINSTMFSGFDLGYASALAWVMFIVTMAITIVLFRSAQRWVYFPDESAHESL